MFLLSNSCKLSLPLGLGGIVSLDFREERLAKCRFRMVGQNETLPMTFVAYSADRTVFTAGRRNHY